MSLKHCISSPLEAGTSILDAGSLPGPVISALEYMSRRLAKKDVHLTLVVVRRDYQLPLTENRQSFSSSSARVPSTSASVMSHSAKPSSSTISLRSIKHLVRSNTFPLTGPSSSTAIQERIVNVTSTYDEGLRTGMISPAFSVSSISSSASTVSTTSTAESRMGSSRRWPLSPTTPFPVAMPATPATPHSDMSMSTRTTAETSSAVSDGPLAHTVVGVRLVHTSPVSSAEEKLLRRAAQRAGRKFHLGPNWFPPAVPPSECGLTADLIHRSLGQNELIFSSDGISLLTLDHLYTFKAALISYTNTQSSCMLEDAVDELRRLVLAQGGKKLCKSVLHSSFAWLGAVSDMALGDVTRMYRRAYGGPSGESAVEDDIELDTAAADHLPCWPLPDEPVFMMIGLDNGKPLPALPLDAWQSSSETTSESGESSGWESEDLPGLNPSQTSHADKRLAIVGLDPLNFDVEDYHRLSWARDLLTEREEAEAAAWVSAGAMDRADGDVLVIALAEESKSVSVVVPPQAIDSSATGRTTPRVTARPRLHIQTTATATSEVIKPTAVRIPALKLQTSFTATTTRPILSQAVSIAPLDRRLTLAGTESALNLVGMTPVDARLPDFTRPNPSTFANHQDEGEEEDGDQTARPGSGHPKDQHWWTQRWNNLSIDGRLVASPGGLNQPMVDGPMTPNGYDDISPITRGEWGFLFQGETWRSGRTVGVEMC